MKARILIVGVFISVIAVFGTAWAESYIPEINTFIKAKDDETKDLASDVGIIARENFYVILEASATVKSTEKKKTFERDSVYTTIIIEDSSNSLSVWIDSAKTYCAEFMEATEGWSKADTKRYSVNYDYMQQLRAQVQKSSAKVYLIAVPVNGGKPRVSLGCRVDKIGQVKVKVAFLDKDVPLSFYQEHTLTVTDPAQEFCEKADDAYKMKDYVTALELYTEAANQGYARAQFSLGYMYETGEGVTRNPVEAAQWYQKAAKQGYAIAQFYLGNMYEIGDGIGKNYNAAVLWYQKAAEQGYANAQYGLGLMYHYGRGVIQNDTTAVKWFQKAAEQNNMDAQFELGYMYRNGEGVIQNYTIAIKWYQMAANQGHTIAQNNLGLMYINGEGVTQNYTVAFQWYQKAAEQGYPLAQNTLGYMYYEGQGVVQDYTAAVQWYQKAAEQGYDTAQDNLGWMYEMGYGVTKNRDTAFEWYKKAADQGNKWGQFHLGWWYFDEGDHTTAKQYFKKAADQGLEKARRILDDYPMPR